MADDITLVCLPAEAPRCIAGSIFTKQCAQCSGRVMIAPSGQRFLKQNPAAHILCSRCYRPELHGPFRIVPGALEEWNKMQLNTWINRN